MNTLESGSAGTHPRRPTRPMGPSHGAAGETPSQRRRSYGGSILLVVFVTLLAVGAAYAYKVGMERACSTTPSDSRLTWSDTFLPRRSRFPSRPRRVNRSPHPPGMASSG